MFKINPELLSNQATHIYEGIKVKLFTIPFGKHYDFKTGEELMSAEIMEGPDKGKWTTVTVSKLQPIKE